MTIDKGKKIRFRLIGLAIILINYKEIWGGNPSVSSLPNALCSHPLPHEENDESEALDLEETGANEKITPTPVKPHDVRDNKRDHVKKNSLPHQRDMMQVDLSRQGNYS